MTPELSVVIPTYRRAGLLRGLLDSLAAQRIPHPFEVVVVDDGSADDTARVVEDAAIDGRALRIEHRGPAAARNEGLRAARGRVVLFLDDDERADPGLVAAHLAAHDAHPAEHQGVLGLVDWAPEVRRTRFLRWLDRSSLQFGFHHLTPGPVEPSYAAFVTANVSVKRSFLLDRGLLFDERFPYPAFEDSDLGWRMHREGFELHYHPEARAYHVRRFRLGEFASRMERVGESFPILREASPDYPLDEGFYLRGPAPAKALALRLASPFLRAFGPDRYASRYYDDRVARAYRRGRSRARVPAPR